MWIAAAYVVENVFMALGASLAVSFTSWQGWVDYGTTRKQHRLLKATHGFTFFAALSFALIQLDPKAFYGIYNIDAINFIKNLCVMFVFMGAQSLMVTYVYALSKSNLGKRPEYLIRVLQISSLVYVTVMMAVMIAEVAVKYKYFGGVPLFFFAGYCSYIFVFGMYCTNDLKRTLIAHVQSSTVATTPMVRDALKRIRNMQILIALGACCGAGYQLYTGTKFVSMDHTLLKAGGDPQVYEATTPLANIITLGCIGALTYGGYHPKAPPGLQPSNTNDTGGSVLSKSPSIRSSNHLSIPSQQASVLSLPLDEGTEKSSAETTSKMTVELEQPL